MKRRGIQVGDEAYVSIRINKVLHLDVIVSSLSKSEVTAEVYGSSEADLIAVSEVLKSACGAVDYLLQKPMLHKLLQERIAQLKEEIALEEGEPPSPTDGIEDIPF